MPRLGEETMTELAFGNVEANIKSLVHSSTSGWVWCGFIDVLMYGLIIYYEL